MIVKHQTLNVTYAKASVTNNRTPEKNPMPGLQ